MNNGVFLASGDFTLRVRDEKTVLTAICPVSPSQISRSGKPEEWSRERWNDFLMEARKFDRNDLLEDIRKLKGDMLRKSILGEDPAFNDESSEKPEAVHSIYVHYFIGHYVAVGGTSTSEHREKLAKLGLRWSPENREWRADYDEELLKSVVEYVRENDTAYDPKEIGYERCSECGEWKPQGKRCPY